VEVQAGQKATLKLQLRRSWKEFTGRVSLLPLTPTGPRAQAGGGPAGQGEAGITVGVNTAPGEYTWTVLGQAQAPSSRDAEATQKANTLVSPPARPITLVVRSKK